MSRTEPLTDRTLLRLHIEAVWGVQLPPIAPDAVDVTLLPESKLPRWKVCVANLDSGRVHLWRPNVAAAEHEALRERADRALALPPQAMTTPDISREVAHSLTATPALDVETAHSIARRLTIEDEALIAADFTEDSPDYFLAPECSPLIGVVVANRLLCIAHSSRRTPEACELGIHTLGIARRRGYALASTILWTQGILQEGLVPLYSAMIENTPSLNLAAAAGYRPFTRTVNIR